MGFTCFVSLKLLQVLNDYHNFLQQSNFSTIICMFFFRQIKDQNLQKLFHYFPFCTFLLGPRKTECCTENHEEKLEFSYENRRNNYHRTEVTLMEKIKYRRS